MATNQMKTFNGYEVVDAEARSDIESLQGQLTSSTAEAKSYTDTKIAALVNGAPETMDTLKEVSDALEANDSVVEALNSAIGNKASKTDLTSHTNNTTVHVTATERTNWNAAEKNQNAFSNVKVGSTTIAADSATDTLTLVAGSNVTLAPDASGDKVTIAATDTVTTVTTSGTGNAITALSATDGKITATKDLTFLTAHPSVTTSTDTTSTATPAHGETITMVDSVTRDGNGHVTKVNTKTVTLPTDNNTDTKVKNTLATTTKAYVTGTTSATTNTGTQVFDTGVYLGTTPGELVATKFTGALSGNATTATKLAASKTVRTNLASTSTASFDGSSNITPGVTGILPITNGGTGASTLDAAKENLGIGAKVIPITQAEYTALGDAVKTDGNIYAVTDAETGRYIPDVCTTITDWNDAITNGWYMGNGASNNPTSSTSGWYFGRVIAHNNKYIYQEVWAFANNASSTVSLPKYIRNCNNGTWSSWYNDTPSKYLTNGGTPYFSGVHIGTSSTSTAYIYNENNNGNIYFRYTDASGNTCYTNIRDIVAALNK